MVIQEHKLIAVDDRPTKRSLLLTKLTNLSSGRNVGLYPKRRIKTEEKA